MHLYSNKTRIIHTKYFFCWHQEMSVHLSWIILMTAVTEKEVYRPFPTFCGMLWAAVDL